MIRRFETTYVSLHIIGMVLMLMDHTWATVLPQYSFLTHIGRIAFPIFAFLTVEGYVHTSNVKKYLLRLFIFALISEIPFNLMYSASITYIYHQNVMWAFLEGVLMFMVLDKLPKKPIVNALSSLLVVLLFFIIGTVTFVDYYGSGLLMMAIFYKFRERTPLNIILTILLMYYVNYEILGGYYFVVNLFGHNFEIVEQSIACLALIPIYLYKGNKGNSPKWFKYFNYSFYPGHMIILYAIYKLVC